MELTLRTTGGSLSAAIPAEMARRFHRAPGDRIQVIETQQGILLTSLDPTVQEALASEAARQCQSALRELAH